MVSLSSRRPRASARWSGRSLGGRWGHRFFYYGLRLFGLGFVYLFLYLVVPYFVLFASGPRRASYDYARRRLGLSRGRARCFVFGHFREFGVAMLDRWALRTRYAGRFSFEYAGDYSAVQEHLSTGRGMVMVGAHFGNPEVGFTQLGDGTARQVYVTRYEGDRPTMQRELARSRVVGAQQQLSLGAESYASMLRAHELLAQGAIVCIQGDRYLPGTTTGRTSFLGASASFPTGVFRLAALEHLPLTAYYAVRTRALHYRFEFHFLPYPSGLPMGQVSQRYMESYARWLERGVRAYPRQWFNYYDFWGSDGAEG